MDNNIMAMVITGIITVFGTVIGTVAAMAIFFSGEIDEVKTEVHEQGIQLIEIDTRNQKVAGCVIRTTADSIEISQKMTEVLEGIAKQNTKNPEVPIKLVSQVSEGWDGELDDIVRCATVPYGLWDTLTSQGKKFANVEEFFLRLNEALANQ